MTSFVGKALIRLMILQTTLSMYVPATGSVVIQDGQTQVAASFRLQDLFYKC